MAWERSFEKKILKIRDKELKYQKLNYVIEVLSFKFFFNQLCLKRSGIDSLDFYLVCATCIDTTKLTLIHYRLYRNEIGRAHV